MSIEKYVGRIVDIIYQDSKGAITKRQLSVHKVRDGKVRGFDTSKQALRSFNVSGILAFHPLGRSS